jgi:uncharacterized FlaG/YvyC family protein
MKESNKKWWFNWSKIQKLVPLIPVVGVIVAILLSITGRLIISIPEGLILSLLALLSIDALLERMTILERIQKNLDELGSSRPQLRWDSDLYEETPFEKYLQGVEELFVSGGSLISLFTVQREVIARWLKQTSDAKLKLILVDPDALRAGKVTVESLHIDQNKETYARDIDKSLIIIKNLQEGFPQKIEFRLTDQIPSLTVMIINKSEAMIALNLYTAYAGQRPAFEVSRIKHPIWFKLFYERYYVNLWEKSK